MAGEGSGLVIGILYDAVVLSFSKAYHSNEGELGCTGVQKYNYRGHRGGKSIHEAIGN